jgi:hypothetical protein
VKKTPLRSFFDHPYAVSALIFCTAFAARVFFYFVMENRQPEIFSLKNVGDVGYLNIARNLVSGNGYSGNHLLTYFLIDHLEPTAARGPVPVLVLALLLLIFRGKFYYLLFVHSWLLSAFTAVALYFLAQNVFKSKKPALVTAFLYCFYMPEMFISATYAAASENVFTLLLICYFLALIRGIQTKSLSSAFLAGALLGLACLSKPVVLFLPVVYAGWMILAHRDKAVSSIASFLVAFFICLSPWVIRNQIVFHKPIFTTTLGGYNLLRHNGMIGQNKYEIRSSGQFDPIALAKVAEAGYDLNRLNEVELDEIFAKAAFLAIRSYPWRYLKLCVMRTAWVWYRVNGDNPPYIYQNILIYLFMFPGFVLVFVRRHFLSVLAVHVFYFILTYAAINAQFRFICPVMPYGIMIAVYVAFLFFNKNVE